MSLNHLLNLPSLQQKLRSAGYESLEEILSSNLTEIVQGTEEEKFFFSFFLKKTLLRYRPSPELRGTETNISSSEYRCVCVKKSLVCVYPFIDVNV